MNKGRRWTHGIFLACALVVTAIGISAAGQDAVTLAIDAVTSLGEAATKFADDLTRVGFDPELLFSGNANLANEMAEVEAVVPTEDQISKAEWTAKLTELSGLLAEIDGFTKSFHPVIPDYLVVLDEVRDVTGELEDALNDEVPHADSECGNGRVLLIVHPGFDCGELVAQVDDWLAKGWCVVILWQELSSDGESGPTSEGGPTQWRLYRCLQEHPLGSLVSVKRDLDPGEGFRAEVVLGDPEMKPHVPPVLDPHPAYGGTDITDIVDPEPHPDEWYDQFGPGDTVVLSVDLVLVCEDVQVDVQIVDPVGELLLTSQAVVERVDPTAACSAATATTSVELDTIQFGPAGDYSVEIWVDGRASAIETITIGNAPAAPIAMDDSYRIASDVPHVGPSVLANDFDPNYQPLLADLQSEPSHGRVSLERDGTFGYDPDPDFEGVDTFTYTATDPDGMSSLGTVTLMITDEPRIEAPTNGP